MKSPKILIIKGILLMVLAIIAIILLANGRKLFKIGADQNVSEDLVLLGRAIKLDNNPVEGFVTLSNGASATIGPDGSFSFSNVSPNKTYVVEVYGFDGVQYGNNDSEFGQIYVSSDEEEINYVLLTDLYPVHQTEGLNQPASDTNPPTITHTPLTTVSTGKDATIAFAVTDPEWGKRFGGVNLYYTINKGDWKLASLNQDETNQDQFTATIPASDLQAGSILSYYIEAADPVNHISYLPDKSGTDPKANAISLSVLASPTSTPTTSSSPTATCKVPDALKKDFLACYSLDEGDGKVAHDGSGKGNDGTIVDSLTFGGWDTACKVKYCLSFGGVNDKVTIPDNPSLNPDAITVAAWVRPNAQTTQKFVSKLSATGTLGYALSGSGCCLSFFGASSSSAYQPNQWVHIVGTAQTGSQAFYINGQNVASGPFAAGLTKVAGPLTLGGFAGALDEIAIFNRVLTDQEVLSLYRAAQ